MQARTRQASLFAMVVGTLVVFGGAGLAQAHNPFLGTWKLNVAKSTYSPGPPPKSGTTTIEDSSQGIRYTVDQVTASGATEHWEFVGNYDGRDNIVAGNNPNGDTVALIRVDANTLKQVNKKAGRITVTQVAVVSSDGKMRTITSTGMNLQGEVVNNVTVYEKQ